MIYVDIRGVYPLLSNSSILEAFFFAVSELMPRKKNLDVTVSITALTGDTTGYHIKTDRYTHEIELERNQNKEDFLTALFHEIVHVRQTERGVYCDEKKPYYKRPTEIEAYKLQEELLKKWKYLQS